MEYGSDSVPANALALQYGAKCWVLGILDVNSCHRVEAVPLARPKRLFWCKSSPLPCRSEPGGRFLYILSGALTTYSIEESVAGAEKAPVPPCILPVEDGTSQVSLEVDDRRAPLPFLVQMSSHPL